MKIKVDLDKLQKKVWGETVFDFRIENFVAWKKNVKAEIIKMQNGERFDERIIYDLANYLDFDEYEYDEDMSFIIDDEKVGIEVLETLFNYIYGDIESTTTTQKKIIMLLEFYREIKYNNICVKVCKTKRELIDYVFIDGKDNEQLIDTIETLLESNNYNWEEENDILKINGMYFVMQW